MAKQKTKVEKLIAEFQKEDYYIAEPPQTNFIEILLAQIESLQDRIETAEDEIRWELGELSKSTIKSYRTSIAKWEKLVTKGLDYFREQLRAPDPSKDKGIIKARRAIAALDNSNLLYTLQTISGIMSL